MITRGTANPHHLFINFIKGEFRESSGRVKNEPSTDFLSESSIPHYSISHISITNFVQGGSGRVKRVNQKTKFINKPQLNLSEIFEPSTLPDPP